MLLTGEAGTGKSVVARTIHDMSRRSDGPFITLGCATGPESLLEAELFGHRSSKYKSASGYPGLLELAHTGTLVLDEVDALPPFLQTKVIHVLNRGTLQRASDTHETPLDVRLLGITTIKDQRPATGSVDSYAVPSGLNVLSLELPALRHRLEDVRVLAHHFITRFAEKHKKCSARSISAEALDVLLSHTWPGNVRQLHECIERAVLICSDEVIERHLIVLSPVHQRVCREEEAMPSVDTRIEEESRKGVLQVSVQPLFTASIDSRGER